MLLGQAVWQTASFELALSQVSFEWSDSGDSDSGGTAFGVSEGNRGNLTVSRIYDLLNAFHDNSGTEYDKLFSARSLADNFGGIVRVATFVPP